jgi:hypothetical protein
MLKGEAVSYHGNGARRGNKLRLSAHILTIHEQPKEGKDERDKRADALRRVQFILARLLRQALLLPQPGKGKTIFSLSGARSWITLNTHIGRRSQVVFYRKKIVCEVLASIVCRCEGFPFLLHEQISPCYYYYCSSVLGSCWWRGLPSQYMHTIGLEERQRRAKKALIHKRLNHTTIYDVKSRVILIFYYTSPLLATCFYSKERKSYFMVSLIEVVKK